MMRVFEHRNGDLVVPRTAALSTGDVEILGDGEQRIGPEHPDFAAWRRDIERGTVECKPLPMSPHLPRR